MTTSTTSQSKFDLQQYLCSKYGDEWLKEVKVNDSNGKSFRYYAPPVAWEDINRHENQSIGDFIFDVTIKMKNDPQNQSKRIRYVLRPQNMTDPIALQSTQQINLPVGNYHGNKLQNHRLIDILSKSQLLNKIGINCTLSGSLYEPLIDEPAHCLPDIECICGASMQRTTVRAAYHNASNVKCDVCEESRISGVIYHCPLNKKQQNHPHGYDICASCVGLQIRTFIEAPKEEHKHNDSVVTQQQQNKNDKYSAGGMMFSVGCALMSENDTGSAYEMEVYLHRSWKYKNGKCLCIITTAEGSTANIIDQCRTTKLKFAKNKKECDWGIAQFDTSTKEGRINERTGKSAETDMIIYFIPVEEDRPAERPNIAPAIGFSAASTDNVYGCNMYPIRKIRKSRRLQCRRQKKCKSSTSNYQGHSNKSKRERVRDLSRDRLSRSRSRSRDRGRNKNKEIESSEEDDDLSLQLKFAKHKMEISERDFVENTIRYPLKRIRELPIRGFLRGAVFFDQTKKPDLSDALRLNNYLQSRYNDTELLSIHAFSVLIKQRAKLLPNADEYYKHIEFIGNLKQNEEDKKNENGIYDLHFTETAAKNGESCVVCMDDNISMIMIECYHMCLCAKCSSEWKMSCPICRAQVQDMVKENTLDKSEIRIIPMAVVD